MKIIIGATCARGYSMEVLSSNAGYYVGTTDDIGLPNCRVSEYFKSQEELKSSPIQFRNCCENSICNEGKDCIRTAC